MFQPKRIIFEKDSLNYEIAQRIRETFKGKDQIEWVHLTNNRVKGHIPGEDLYHQYREGKKTLVVGVKKSLSFQTCKPSAHYQLPLVSGCMGQCQYCYLNTQLGDKPFIKVHANVEEILDRAARYMEERLPEITIFEGAATSDPVPVEPYTHSLAKAITFFGASEMGRFRFVTKYDDVDTLLDLDHRGHTEIRFSINTDRVIKEYELGTASWDKRIEASMKVAKAGYPTGFLVAPVFLYPNWQEEYRQLLVALKERLPDQLQYPVTFEIISHRYTTQAKNRILQIFPDTTLPMDDAERKFKFGQFGYGKYVYEKEDMAQIKAFFSEEIEKLFDHKEVKYII